VSVVAVVEGSAAALPIWRSGDSSLHLSAVRMGCCLVSAIHWLGDLSPQPTQGSGRTDVDGPTESSEHKGAVRVNLRVRGRLFRWQPPPMAESVILAFERRISCQHPSICS
jgi:hypothetical protein